MTPAGMTINERVNVRELISLQGQSILSGNNLEYILKKIKGFWLIGLHFNFRNKCQRGNEVGQVTAATHREQHSLHRSMTAHVHVFTRPINASEFLSEKNMMK